MTPTFSTKFTIQSLKARVTDLFNYATIISDAVYANVTAKIGNSIFHTNTNYDASADIVIGVNTYVDIDLPTSDGEILNGTYTIIENVEIVNEVLYQSNVGSGYMAVNAIGASPFTSVVATSPPVDFEEAITALLAELSDVRVGFYNNSNVLLGSTAIDSVSGDTISFASYTLGSYASVTKIRIIGTNVYTTTTSYSYSGCPVVTPKLQSLTDCYRSQLSVTDCTQYPAGSTLARTLTVQYPLRGDGSHVLPTVTTSNASVTLGPNIWSGGYTISLSSVLNWQQTDSLYIELTATASLYPNVQCDAGLCGLSDCIAKFRQKYIAAIQNGSRDIQALTQDNMVIMLYLNAIDLALMCQDTTKAAALTSALRVFMSDNASTEGCDCGCGATTDGVSTEIFPLFSEGVTDGRLVEYSSTVAYPYFQQVLYNGQVFLVTTATNIGDTPDSARSKFKYVGGGVYTGNASSATPAATTITYSKTCGVLSFSGLTVATGGIVTITITNTTIGSGTDVDCYLTDTTGDNGGPCVIVNKVVTGNTITLKIYNFDAGNLSGFKVWFNNKA